jgi:autotransporter-associated beta strand protein
MNRTIQLLTSLICFLLWQAPVQGATNYWDIDGSIAGAGGPMPSGIWDTGTTTNWTASSAGTSAATTWTDGDDAIFSAGNDATGTYSVSFEGNQTVGNLTVEEGNITFGDYNFRLNVGGNVAGKGLVNIASGAALRLETELVGGDDTGLLTKTGTGTLVISYVNYTSGLLIKEGVVGSANNTAIPDATIVSNGAALHLLGNVTGAGGSKILNGNGVANTGAFRNLSSGYVNYYSGATLGSDARIQHDGTDRFDWAIGRIVGNNVNLTIGGNGEGRIRLNIAYPSVSIGTGVFIKEGKCKLQLEQPNYCGAFYLNGGSVYARAEGSWGGFGTNTTIFVEGTGGAFAADFQSLDLDKKLSVAAGANVGFICNLYVDHPNGPTPYNVTCNGVISGSGGLWKTNWGTVFLNKANTYSGNTTIQWGPLTLGTNGSIANTPVIDVWSGGTFDITSKASGFVLGAAQTLKGNGTVLGNVTANGTISPGASVGTLAFAGNLTLATGAKLLIDVDKSLSPASDLMTVSGTLNKTGTGTVTVSNLNPGQPLAIGDSFQLFDKALANGQLMSVTGAGVIWTNRLAVDGSITVLSIPIKVPATNLTIQVVDPTSRAVGGMGAANSLYKVFASTNVTLPMTSWWEIGSTTSSAGGVIDFLDSEATNSRRFYRFGQ